MNYNYHTHTSRCHHAVGKDEEYVRAAIKAGFEEIGFSDHSPWPFENGYVSSMRMTVPQLQKYLKSVRHLREKYKDKISIKIGLECEYFREYLPWLRNMAKEESLDYLILGHHFSPDEQSGDYNGFITQPQQIERYKDDVIEAMDSGLFSYIAHPDLFMRSYPTFDEHAKKVSREIIQKSNETGIPLEYNLLGIAHGKEDGRQGYPYPDFWRLAAEMGVSAVIGIDAHDPKSYLDKDLYASAREYLESLGIKPLDRVELKSFR